MLEAALGPLKDANHNPGIKIPDPYEKYKVLTLPDDYEKTIPAEALTWLAQYGIMREEIIANGIGWSKVEHGLVFPYRAGGALIAYQIRNFSPNAVNKWFSKGKLQDYLHIMGFGTWANGGPIVVVEDIISAIKVARHARAMPLFGSQMNLTRCLRIRWFCKKIYLWLDADKYAESIGYAKRLENLGLETRVIYTEKDPKEYGDEEIKAFLK